MRRRRRLDRCPEEVASDIGESEHLLYGTHRRGDPRAGDGGAPAGALSPRVLRAAHLAGVLPVLVAVTLASAACASLKTKRFADDPAFPENARRIALTVHRPFNVAATRTYSFASEKPGTEAASARVRQITRNASGWRVGSYQRPNDTDLASQEHTLVVVDPSGGRTYEIFGQTTVWRGERKVSGGVSEGLSCIVTPVMFRIREGGRQAGRLSVTWSSPRELEIHMDVILDRILLRIVYGGDLSGKRYFAFEKGGELAAFAELFNWGTSGSGEVLVKSDLDEGLEQDVLSLLAVAEVLVEVLDQLDPGRSRVEAPDDVR